MIPAPRHDLIPGEPISVGDLRDFYANVESLGNFSADAPLNLQRGPGGYHLRLDLDAIAQTLNLTNNNVTINSSQNDYNISSSVTLVDATAAFNFTGFVSPGTAQVIFIKNIGTFVITFVHESASSTAANRFKMPTASDLNLPPQSIAMFKYDLQQSRWQPVMNQMQQYTAYTKSQITSGQNDYALSEYAHEYRLSTDASRTVTGFANGYAGRLVLLMNIGSFDLVIANQSASSSAANRVITGSAASLTLAADQGALMAYDGTSSRWRVIGHTGTTTIADASYTVAGKANLSNQYLGAGIKSFDQVRIPTTAGDSASNAVRVKAISSGGTEYCRLADNADTAAVRVQVSAVTVQGTAALTDDMFLLGASQSPYVFHCYYYDAGTAKDWLSYRDSIITLPFDLDNVICAHGSFYAGAFYFIENSTTFHEGQTGTSGGGDDVKGGLITTLAATTKVTIIAGDPGTPVNGNIWYNSSSNELKAYVNGSTVVLA